MSNNDTLRFTGRLARESGKLVLRVAGIFGGVAGGALLNAVKAAPSMRVGSDGGDHLVDDWGQIEVPIEFRLPEGRSHAALVC